MLYEQAEINKAKASLYNGNTLAYIGDTVYQIMIQEYLLSTHDTTVKGFHKLATGFLNHTFQSDAMECLLPVLSQEEHSVYLRGRNSPKPCGKRSDPGRHSRATGFEALVGYLYLCGESERLNALFRIVLKTAPTREP